MRPMPRLPPTQRRPGGISAEEAALIDVITNKK
jgi:hypothetical protein